MNRYIKDALFGAIAGAAGTFVITKAMGALSQIQSDADKKREHDLIPEPPTEKLARRVSATVGIELDSSTKTSMGKAVQWGYGIFWGAAYGVLRRRFPQISWAGGLPFGVGLGLVGNGVLLPLMDLTPPAHHFPISAHARSILSHYAYGTAVEGVCLACDEIEHAVSRQPLRTKAELRQTS
jgi:uncharacterized membrane protein YagU involved in acid resistance